MALLWTVLRGHTVVALQFDHYQARVVDILERCPSSDVDMLILGFSYSSFRREGVAGRNASPAGPRGCFSCRRSHRDI